MTAEVFPDRDFPLAVTILRGLVRHREVDGVHWGPNHVVVHWDKLADTRHFDGHDRAAVRCIQAVAALELAQGAGPHRSDIRSALLQALDRPPNR